MTIGDHTAALQTDELHRELAERINLRLWDRQTLCCYDRTYSGAFRRTLTTDSFLPLFAGLCDPRQAHCLLSHLTPLLDCPFPVPGAADKLSGVRLSRNYFIYIGLQRYGFGRQASLLRKKTLEGVRKQFRETGCIFGEYDSSTGSPLADADCSETASFVQLLLRS